MPRAAKLCRHEGYWYTKAGSTSGVYFGRCDDVPFNDAKRLFREYLVSLANDRKLKKIPSHSVISVCASHLRWVERYRSPALFRQRRSLLTIFCHYVVGSGGAKSLAGEGEPIGYLAAARVTRLHAEDYLDFRSQGKEESQPIGDKTRRAIVIALKACWNWAANSVQDGGGGMLNEDHRALAKLSRGFVAPKDLTEADLITDEEIEILFSWAMVDISRVRGGNGKFRQRRPYEFLVDDDWRVLPDMLRVYHATGARTGELCQAQVRDFMPRTRQLCLGKHKRVRTLRSPSTRNIQLGVEAFAIVERNAAGKDPNAPLFSRVDGKAWTQNEINKRLRAVKTAAAKHGQIVRDHITPYSFRDLFITDLLMLGTPIFQVAKMAGTSIEEIERTYGHFYAGDLAAAQAKLDSARKARWATFSPKLLRPEDIQMKPNKRRSSGVVTPPRPGRLQSGTARTA